MDDIQEDCQAHAVGRVDEALEVLRRTVPRRYSEERSDLVSE